MYLGAEAPGLFSGCNAGLKTRTIRSNAGLKVALPDQY